MTSWIHERALHPERYASEPRARLESESRFLVRLSDSEVVCERPDGRVERVGWSDLQQVEVVTTGDGPFAPDFSGCFTAPAEAARCHKALPVTRSCLSAFGHCQDSTIRRSLRRCPPLQTGDLSVGRERRDHVASHGAGANRRPASAFHRRGSSGAHRALHRLCRRA